MCHVAFLPVCVIVSSDSGVEKVCYIKNVPSEIVKLSVKLSTSVDISLNIKFPTFWTPSNRVN